MTSPDVVIRDAEALDLRSLSVALANAADWNGSTPISPGEVMLRPDLARYLSGWPWPDDLGVVASIDGRDVGAAWARCSMRSSCGCVRLPPH